jgi:hypothetical protein
MSKACRPVVTEPRVTGSLAVGCSPDTDGGAGVQAVTGHYVEYLST